MVETLRWVDGSLELLDQTRLPHHVEYVRCFSADDVSRAIKALVVRGAPAIGVAAAYGVACEAMRLACLPMDAFRKQLIESCQLLSESRPTAVNLSWAVKYMLGVLAAQDDPTPNSAASRLLTAARELHIQDVEANRAIGRNGAALVPRGARVLTHCNAGALATAGFGTALGIIREAWKYDQTLTVIADETRPLLQGARLTAWELLAEGIPTTLITDNTSGYLMSRGEIDVVIVGADRVARNGDVANKIGTYMVAVLAQRHKIPFIVACPCSTIDRSTASGSEIIVEERSPAEVLGYGDQQWAPNDIAARNPAFDVTPASLVTAIVTEQGVIHAPNEKLVLSHLGLRSNSDSRRAANRPSAPF